VNTYTPSRYDERVLHLAVGIEPRDATSGRRLDGPVDVRFEHHPSPLHRWRNWRPGETLTAVLPPMRRHRSGRFARTYDRDIPTTIDLRVVDGGRVGSTPIPGHGRRVVPRRLRLTIADEGAVLAAEADATSPPLARWRRVFPIVMFPGAAAPLTARSTVLRGRILRRPDPARPETVPVPWCRVRATNADGDEVGWAHGDDRGEFVLVVGQTANDIVVPNDPLSVTLTIGAVIPPMAPDPADPLRPDVDPLWDLPVETVVASAIPDIEPTISGRSFLQGQVQLSPLFPAQPIDLPLGRESSEQITIA